jgi:haloacetate dehalogenase
VVVPDLRGYGDSGKPQSGADHTAYCKRAMARDQIELMEALGFGRFHLAGHDRGARVGYRLAYDYPDRLHSLAILDVVATADIFANVNDALASAYFHWFLMLQPEPLAETLIGGDPAYYLRWLLDKWCTTPGAITDEAFAEYLRCFGNPETLHAMCEDYRAAPIDIAHDNADADRKISCPTLVLWGSAQQQHPGWPSVSLDIMATWRARRDGDGPPHCLRPFPAGRSAARDRRGPAHLSGDLPERLIRCWARATVVAVMRTRFVVEQDAVCGAIEVLELAILERPQERAQPEQTQKQRGRYQIEETGHGARLRWCKASRMAFSVTTSEDADIAAAAINGVTRPATASGSAIMLYAAAKAKFCSTNRRARRATPSVSITGARASP